MPTTIAVDETDHLQATYKLRALEYLFSQVEQEVAVGDAVWHGLAYLLHDILDDMQPVEAERDPPSGAA